MMEDTVGIDLGTTNSCVAICKNNKIDIIENDAGSRVTPSFVTFTEDVVLTGPQAINNAHKYPKTSIYESKRLIGQKYSDPKVRDDIKRFTFPVVNDLGHPKIVIKLENQEERKCYPEEISSYILQRMKKIADERLQTDVKRAVITVPAYFNDAQRQATIDAGKIAGFETINVINEPTAAALAFDHKDRKPYRRNVVVYDFGGGTFDVSIVAVGRGRCEVKATSGDTHLGGTDIDMNLVKFVKEDFKKRFGTDVDDQPEERRDETARRLKAKCEKAKKILSGGQIHTTIELDSLCGKDYTLQISKAKFEKLNDSVFEKTIKIVKDCLKDSGLPVDKIDEVVLVGGSSRIPKIQQLLTDLFGEGKLNKTVNPDEAVAYGAAIHASNLAGNKNEINDVTSMSLGTNTHGDQMSIIIHRNTPVPAKAIKRYSTINDDQTEMDFPIYQGEEETASSNYQLGEFTMTGLTPAPAKSVTVEVCYELDAEGLLHVSAAELNSTKNNKTKLDIDMKKMGLSEEQITERRKQAELNKERHKQKRTLDEKKHKLEELLYRAQEHAEHCEEANKTYILSKYDEYFKWMDKAKINELEKIDDVITEIEDILLKYPIGNNPSGSRDTSGEATL